MPRTKAKISKSQFIRDYLSQNPEATNDEIIRAAHKVNIKINGSSIGYVRYKKPSIGPTSETIETAPPAIEASIPIPRDNPFAQINRAKEWVQMSKEFDSVRKFCESHGGIERTKAIIESLEKYDQLKALLN
jgi:hypothetical protein